MYGGHAYKAGTGNLCGTPALSSNHGFNVPLNLVMRA
jgi:hypothetical protein